MLNKYSDYIVSKDDIIISLTGTLGKKDYGYAVFIKEEEKFLLNQRLVKIIPKSNKIVQNYLLYFFQSNFFLDSLYSKAFGTKQANISSFDLINLNMIFLPIKEQTAIANFLDEKTGTIDSAIEELENQRRILKELKQATIHKAVTKGLDDNVPMKDSGVEWIGEIPVGKKVIKLKYVVDYDTSGEVIDKSFWGGSGKIPTYSASKKILYTNFENFPNYKLTTKKDLLLARNGDGNIHIPESNCIYTNVVQLVRISKNFDREFVYYGLVINKKHIAKRSYGDIIASLNREQWFNNSYFVNFNKKEQEEIVKYLDNKVLKIDNSLKEINSEITHLKEYKKTLVNDAVTGKIKVYGGEI